MQFYYYLILFFVVSVIVTYFLKKKYNAKTYLIFSIFKSEKLAKKFDKLKFGKSWDFLADLGIVLGFGACGAIFLRKGKRKLVTALIILLLYVCFFGIYFFAGKTLLESLLVAGVFAIFGFAGLVVYLLIEQTIMLFKLFIQGQSKCVGVAPVIPGVKIPKVPITIPFFEGWIALIVGMVIHELSHAVLMKKAKVKIKAFGPLLLGFLPIGAFVEPNEAKLKSLDAKSKFRLYAAGPSSNIVFSVAVFILYILFGFLTSSYVVSVSQNYGEIIITGTEQYGGICGEGGEALNYNAVEENTKLLAVDNVTIVGLTDFKKQINSALKKNEKSITALLEKDGAQFEKELYFNDKNYLGINLEQRYSETPFRFKAISFVSSLLYWLFLLNLLIGIFNFLPVVPFDGGVMAPGLFSPLLFFVKKEKREKIIMKFFIALIVILLVLNLLPIFG